MTLVAAGQGWRGTHIRFEPATVPPARRTKVWHVFTAYPGASHFLGNVSWFARWRKYAFFPHQDTVFEEVCMRDISEFIEERTREHKDGQKK